MLGVLTFVLSLLEQWAQIQSGAVRREMSDLRMYFDEVLFSN